MSVDETTLICPHCGATYRDGDTVCPNCGKPLSPTGYSSYGDEAAVEPSPAPVTPLESDPAIAEDALDTPLIEDAPATTVPNEYSSPVIARVAEPSLSLDNSNATQTARQSAASARTRDFGAVQSCAIFILIGIVGLVIYIFDGSHTSSNGYTALLNTPVPGTPTEPPDPAAVEMKESYLLLFAGESGSTLNDVYIKMYNLNTYPVIFPDDKVMNGAVVQVSPTAVEFDTNSKAISVFHPNNLAYRRGTALLPILNGKVSASKLIIIRDARAAVAQYPRSSYVVAGQTDYGYEYLDQFESGTKISEVVALPVSDDPTPTMP